jgi:hypothetical protein
MVEAIRLLRVKSSHKKTVFKTNTNSENNLLINVYNASGSVSGIISSYNSNKSQQVTADYKLRVRLRQIMLH